MSGGEKARLETLINKNSTERDNDRNKVKSKKEAQGASSYLTKFFIPSILIMLAGLVVYGGTFNRGFIHFDDDLLFQGNVSVIRDMTMKNVYKIFSSDAFNDPAKAMFYRPLQTLSYMFDMQINAGAPATFYISNFIIHCLACMALFHLLILLRFDRRLSLAVVLLYAVHPLFCMAVSWMPARGDLLLGLFVVTSFICFIKLVNSTTHKYSIFYLACGLLFYLLALFSKETAIGLPVIVALYCLLEKRKSFKDLFSKDNVSLLFLVSGMIIITILWYLARRNAIPMPIEASQFGIGPFVKNLATIPEFAAKFIIPVNVAPIPGFLRMVTALGLATIAVLIVLTILNKDKNYTTILLGIAWFLVFLFPAMTFRHEFGDTAYSYLNHRAYLPMMGMLIFILSIVPRNLQKKSNLVIIIPVAFVTILFTIVSRDQTKNYNDEMSFYNSAIEANQHCSFCYNNRGRIFAAKGEFDKSMLDFNKAIELNPESAGALSNRGNVRKSQKDYQGAIADFREAIRLKPNYAPAYNNIGIAFYNLNRITESLEAYNKALELKTDYVDAFANRALLKIATNDYRGAIEDYSKAIAIRPNIHFFYANRAVIYFRLNEIEKACGDWKRAAERGDQNSAQNYRNTCHH